MKLNLEESEIKVAIARYVKSKVTLEPGQELDIEFSTGRNPLVISAAVDIVDCENSEETPPDANTVTPAIGGNETDGDSAGEDNTSPFKTTENDVQQTIPFAKTSDFLQGN